MKITIGHLYPDYLNIYADRGNIAVFAGRARPRGVDLEVVEIGAGEPAPPRIDLFYVGGGQDREQALIAPDLAARGPELRQAIADGAAVLAVCGGYQLLGRRYVDRSGEELPGAGLFPLETVAGERRMIGDVLLECELQPGERRTLAGFENHAGRTQLDPGAQPLGRVLAGYGNDGESGYEGCRVGRAIGTYLHGPLLPRNPWLADWLLAQAVAHATGDAPPSFDPLPDELEAAAHEVAAARARRRGGNPRRGSSRFRRAGRVHRGHRDSGTAAAGNFGTTPMETREARLAANEAIFREVNERIADSHTRFGSEDSQEFLCECSDARCSTRVRLTLAEYQRVRGNPLRFVVTQGHENPDIEHVVETAAEFLVVEKIGAGAAVAVATDPRADTPPAS